MPMRRLNFNSTFRRRSNVVPKKSIILAIYTVPYSVYAIGCRRGNGRNTCYSDSCED